MVALIVSQAMKMLRRVSFIEVPFLLPEKLPDWGKTRGRTGEDVAINSPIPSGGSDHSQDAEPRLGVIGFHIVAPRRLAHGVERHEVEFLRRRDGEPLPLAFLVLEVLVGDDAIVTTAVAIGSLDPPSGATRLEVGGLTVTVVVGVVSGLVGEVHILGLHEFPFCPKRCEAGGKRGGCLECVSLEAIGAELEPLPRFIGIVVPALREGIGIE